MKALENKKHERFARLLTQGLSQVEAFRQCYPDQKPESVNTNAAKLAGQLHVRERIAEITEFVDSQFAMVLGEKRDLLRRMIDGTVPTKVIRKADGKIDAIFDRLAALQMDSKIAGEFAPEQMQVNTGHTLKLEFNMVGRNTAMTPALEAEWERINPETKRLTEPPSGQQDDFQQYMEAEIRPHKIVSLDSLKQIIDEPTE